MTATTANSMQKLLIQEQNFTDGVMAMGNALLTINNQGLYKARGYTSFDSYCQEHWQIKSNYAYKQITAAKVKAKLCTICTHSPIADGIVTEGQLRALTDVDDSFLEAVVEEAGALAEDKNSRVTTAILRRAKAKVVGTTSTKTHQPTDESKIRNDDHLDKVERRAKELIEDRLRSLRLQFSNLLIGDKAEPHLKALEKLRAAA